MHTFHPISLSPARLWEVVERIYSLVKVEFRTQLVLGYTSQWLTNALGLEDVTFFQRTYNTYAGIDISNVCETLTKQVKKYWSAELKGYLCEQYVAATKESLEELQKSYCQGA